VTVEVENLHKLTVDQVLVGREKMLDTAKQQEHFFSSLFLLIQVLTRISVLGLTDKIKIIHGIIFHPNFNSYSFCTPPDIMDTTGNRRG